MYRQQRLENPPSKLTCCFCVKYNYDAEGVYKSAFSMDIIFFLLIVIGDSMNSSNKTNLKAYALLNLLLIFAVVPMVLLALFYRCNLQSFRSKNILKAKVSIYMNIRACLLIYLFILSVVLGVIYLVVSKKWVNENWDDDDQNSVDSKTIVANTAAASAFLGTVLPVLFDILIFLGYRSSFHEAVEKLSQVAPTQQVRPNTVPARAFTQVPDRNNDQIQHQPAAIPLRNTSPFQQGALLTPRSNPYEGQPVLVGEQAKTLFTASGNFDTQPNNNVDYPNQPQSQSNELPPGFIGTGNIEMQPRNNLNQRYQPPQQSQSNELPPGFIEVNINPKQ